MSVDPVLIVPAALGVLALVALLAWRLPRRRLRSLSRQIDSFDPDKRARADAGVVELGLTRRTANVLTHSLTREEDLRLRFAIALAVVRNSERSRRRRVRQLRKWSVEELVEHGHPVHQGLEWKKSKITWRAPAPQS